MLTGLYIEDLLVDDYSYNDVYYHPYPRKNSTDVDVVLDDNKLPEIVYAEDNNPDTKIYVAKTGDGETITHFTTPTYFTDEIWTEFDDGVPDFNFGMLFDSFKIDENCAKDYAVKLLPTRLALYLYVCIFSGILPLPF